MADEQLWPVPSLDDVPASTRPQHVVRRARARRWRPASRCRDRRRRCRRGDLPPPRRNPAGDRAGRIAPAVDDRRPRCAIGSMIASGCWSDRGAAWSVTRPCATPCSGPTTCSTTTKSHCWQRCSVFAGGFDLAGARRVADSGDEFATLDLLDALVRKSLLVADRSSGRTRFSMLETIRQFAEEQLVATWRADEARAAHARYFAGREADVLALWDGPRQREAYAWFDRRAGQPAHRIPMGCRPRRHRHRGDDRRLRRRSSACGSNSTSPSAWARKSSTAPRLSTIRRLAQLYAMATQCFTRRPSSRTPSATPTRRRQAIDSGRFDEVPTISKLARNGPYIGTVSPSGGVELCRNMHRAGRGRWLLRQGEPGGGADLHRCRRGNDGVGAPRRSRGSHDNPA